MHFQVLKDNVWKEKEFEVTNTFPPSIYTPAKNLAADEVRKIQVMLDFNQLSLYRSGKCGFLARTLSGYRVEKGKIRSSNDRFSEV